MLHQLWLRNQLQERWSRLYRIAYSWCHDQQLSKDLTQDTVMKALKKGHQLQDPQAFDTWLFSILINCWRDVCRRRRETQEIVPDSLVDTRTPEDDSQRTMAINRVRRAVGELSTEHREIVTLVDLEQMSYKEVAQVLDLPIGTVMSRLCRARRQLRERLHDLHSDGDTPLIRRVK